jgi:RNA polymerase sigma factor (sigma-70 family)
MPEVDDHELLQQWQGGDAAAGELLVERYFDPIYWFFRSKLDAEADELVQSTFLACLAAKDRFRGDSSFRTFLYGIARNQLFAALRGRSRADQHIDLEVSSIADLVSTPRTKLARGQEYEQLIGQLRRLPVEQQTLLELHYWGDVGIGELAEIFEAPEVTIRSRLHRARNALRELLQAEPGLVEALEPSPADVTGVSLDTIDSWARRLSPVRTG